MVSEHQNIKEIYMHPKYKSNSNISLNMFTSHLSFLRKFLGKKLFHQNEGVNLKKGQKSNNQESHRLLVEGSSQDNSCTGSVESRVQMGPDLGGRTAQPASPKRVKTDGYLGCLHVEKEIYPSDTFYG